METTSSITENAIEGIKKSSAELEDFQVQLALGKADTKDEYQQLKRNFKAYLDESRHRLEHSLNIHDKSSERSHQIFEELNNLLQTELFENKEVYELERQQLKEVLTQLNKELHQSEYHDEHTIGFIHEMEKFSIKMDMLHLKLDLLKLENQEKIQEKKAIMQEKLSAVFSQIEQKEESLKDQWIHFKDEIQEAFGHIRDAITDI